MIRPDEQPEWAEPIPVVLPAPPDEAPVADAALPTLNPYLQPIDPLVDGQPRESIEALPEVEEALPVDPPEVVPDIEPLLYAEAYEPPTPVAARGGRGWPLIAWIVIGLLVCYEFASNHIVPYFTEVARERFSTGRPDGGQPAPGGEAAPNDVPAEVTDTAEAQVEFAVMEMQARYLVGWNNLVRQQAFYDQARQLNTGSPEQRLRAIVLIGELGGPNDAIGELQSLDRQVPLAGLQRELRDILLKLYRDHQRRQWTTPSLTPHDRELLKDELGWFGRLALAPADGHDKQAREDVLKPAKTTAIAVVSVFGVLGLLGIIGFVLLVIFAVCLLAGWLRRGFGRAGPYGGVYAETFALWMAVFLGMNLAGPYVLEYLDQRAIAEAAAAVHALVEGEGGQPAAPPQSTVWQALKKWRLGLFGMAELATLLVVFWPLVRGVPWRELKHDLGLNWGRRPLAEPFLGIGCYIMSLPLLGIGFVITVLLMLLFGAVPGVGGAELLRAEHQFKSHPIVEMVAKGDWLIKLQVLFLASVVAPIVEEIMFRGVLYRHLRDGTGQLGFALSLFLSGTVTSFIFAVIHPQDPLAFPALMALAYGFTLAREWRGTLIPGMVMHGLHNGLLMLLLMLMLSG
jgi:membrane protease YdiL (CAAX protease family)